MKEEEKSDIGGDQEEDFRDVYVKKEIEKGKEDFHEFIVRVYISSLSLSKQP